MVLEGLTQQGKSIDHILSLLCFDYPQAFLPLFPTTISSLS